MIRKKVTKRKSPAKALRAKAKPAGKAARPARKRAAGKKRAAPIRSGPRQPPGPPPPEEQVRQRLDLFLGLFLLAFFILGVRAMDLTVLQGDRLRVKAQDQHKKRVAIPAHRGRITDRHGRPLAISLPVKSLSANIDLVEDRKALANKLAPILGISKKRLRRKLVKARKHSFPVLRRKLPPGVVKKVEALNAPGLFFREELQRFYPFGEVTAHLIGFVNIDGKGMEGLESAYDAHLTGRPGSRMITRDRRGRLMPESTVLRAASPGGEVRLTIDATIQYVAYRALLKGIERAKGKSGTVVVLDPNNGEILAMVSQPGFNPNNLGRSTPESRRHRAIYEAYEPGSTFKVFTVGAALDKGLIKPETVFDCENGRFKVQDRTIRDHHKYGDLTVAEILQKSSNTCSAKIGLQMGDREQEEYLRKFGFGAPTGVEVGPETGGRIPDIRHYRDVGLANRSFGQGVSVTSLQTAAAGAAAINGGLWRQPRLVLSGEKGGQVIKEPPPIVRRAISVKTSRQLREILKGVVLPGGTAPKARLEGYEASGKTGTAQKASRKGGYAKGKYIASFLGFAPADKPKLVILAMVDEPTNGYYGGEIGGPIFREIAQEILPHLGALPRRERAAALPGRRPKARAAPQGDMTGISLAEALEKLHAKGVIPRISGYGRVQGIAMNKQREMELSLR